MSDLKDALTELKAGIRFTELATERGWTAEGDRWFGVSGTPVCNTEVIQLTQDAHAEAEVDFTKSYDLFVDEQLQIATRLFRDRPQQLLREMKDYDDLFGAVKDTDRHLSEQYRKEVMTRLAELSVLMMVTKESEFPQGMLEQMFPILRATLLAKHMGSINTASLPARG